MLSIESPESLSSWLTKELSPICDADPGALAKYVLALLKKPLSGDEIKDVCLQQLEVFLQSHTKRFVEKLFTAMSERSYMESAADTPTPVVSSSTVAVVEEKKEKKEEKKEKEKKKEVPKEKSEERKEKSKEKEPSPPHSASASTSQSSSSISNDRPRRPPPSSSSATKREGGRDGGSTSDSAAPSVSSTRRSPVRAPRKRVSPPPQLSRRRSRSPPVRGNRRVAGVRRSPIREKRRSRSRSPIDKERRRERGERDEDQPRKKKRCRDFDEQGVCLRGEACPYDHGLDPVVVENAALAAMGLKTAAAVATSTYSVPPPGYNPINNPPPPGVEAVGYNPEAPGLGMGDFSVPPPPIPVVGGWRQANPYGMQPQQVGYEPSGSIPVDPHNGGMMGGMGGMMRGRGRGRGRGGYHPYGRGGMGGGAGGGDMPKEEALAAPVAARTLIVKKIPAELNNISKLNEHFEQFGSITNMQVHYERQPDTALITFSSRFEATKAYKNPEPIFNNRFIRVFWYSNVTETGPNKTTLSSGVTVETPGGEPQLTPVVSREPVVLPGPGQTKYRKPEAVEAFKKKQEVAAVRKADKEAVLRQKDLLRRTTRILSSLQEQQKQVIMAMMKETDAEKKKTLNKMYKQLEGKIASQKGDVEEQQEKLKTFEAKVAKNETEGGAEGGSSGDEALLSPDEGVVRVEEENEDDLLSAQVDEEFAAIKQEQLVE